MSYYMSRTVDLPMDEAEALIREKLADRGFGILTEIDVTATFKKKLDVDFKPYKILGACNPHYAHESLTREEHMGALLPCNVYLIGRGDNKTEVSAIDPGQMVAVVNNPELDDFATKVKDVLQEALDAM